VENKELSCADARAKDLNSGDVRSGGVENSKHMRDPTIPPRV
jgi:hypothetical protein